MAKISPPTCTSSTSSSPTWPRSLPSTKSVSATPWVRSGPCGVFCSCAMAKLLRSLDHSEKLPAKLGVVTKTSQHAARNQTAVRLVHPSRGHAMMHRLDNDADPFWFEHGIDRIGDLSGHFFLNLEAPGEGLHDARELADADHAPARNVGDTSLPDDGRDVVFAMTLETNVAQNHHLVIAVDLFERLLQDLGGILA